VAEHLVGRRPGRGESRQDMKNAVAFTSTACLALALAACSAQTTALSEQQVVSIVWQALEPNTSSHNQANWEVISVQSVVGQEVHDLFEGEPVHGGCASGPLPPDNATITPNRSFWHVVMKPRPVTPQPWPTEQFSPTAPPHVPEPLVYEAHFLVDGSTGEIAGRKLYCNIY
jgi:hypothetical protein